MFHCDNHMCIYKNLTCNGRNDCFDWSDEAGCPCSKLIKRQRERERERERERSFVGLVTIKTSIGVRLPVHYKSY